MNMMQPSKQNTQSGSAFFLILIGIFLFAGLSFALMQSSRTSMSTLSAEQARVAAQEIIAYADGVAKAVQKMKLAGCSDSMINFYTSISGFSYRTTSNPNAPSDKTCDVFDINGGKINMIKANESWKDPASTYNFSWMANFSNMVTGVGTSAPELALFLITIKPEICTAINKIAGVTNPSEAPPTNAINDPGAGFIGNYSSAYTINNTYLNTHSEFCLNESGQYKYYRVLIAR